MTQDLSLKKTVMSYCCNFCCVVPCRWHRYCMGEGVGDKVLKGSCMPYCSLT